MKFLAVITKMVVDQPFVAAVEAVPEVLDEDGNVVTPGIEGRDEIPLQTHQEIDQVYVEDSAETVARVIGMQADDPEFHPNLKFYGIRFDENLVPGISAVREKKRAPAPAKTLVTIEADDGEELGSTEIG